MTKKKRFYKIRFHVRDKKDQRKCIKHNFCKYRKKSFSVPEERKARRGRETEDFIKTVIENRSMSLKTIGWKTRVGL